MTDELERLALAATPHRWTEFHSMSGPMGVMSEGGTLVCRLAIHGGEHANAAFIAAANPATILDLLAANRKMREGLERIKREDIHHEGDDIDNYDSASGHQSRAWLGPFGTIARSALSTKEQPDV